MIPLFIRFAAAGWKMDKVGDIYKEFFSHLLKEKENEVSIFSSWQRIAGDDIASHSRVADIRRGALIVEVDHPGWMQMLQIKSSEILQRLSAKYPNLGIRMLQGKLVKQGQFSPAEREAEPPQPGTPKGFI